jgi:hypothetical protein
MCSLHFVDDVTKTTPARLFLRTVLEASPNKVHSYIRHRSKIKTFDFTDALFLFQCLALGLNRQPAGCVHVKLCVKSKLQSLTLFSAIGFVVNSMALNN